MFDLTANAQGIVDRLTIAGVARTVRYLDTDTQAKEYPAVYPACFVALDGVRDVEVANSRTRARVVWAVVVIGKRFDGDKGLMAVVDAALDALSGVSPVDGQRPLALVDIRFQEITAEAASYVIRMASTVTAQPRGC